MSNSVSTGVRENPASWFVYMVQTAGNRLYTGITTDPARRFREHQSGKGGAKFFRSNRPVEIVYLESAADRSSASKREHAVKKMNRTEKLALIDQAGPPVIPHESGAS